LFLHANFVVEMMAYGVGPAHWLNVLKVLEGALVLCQPQVVQVLLHFKLFQKFLLRRNQFKSPVLAVESTKLVLNALSSVAS